MKRPEAESMDPFNSMCSKAQVLTEVSGRSEGYCETIAGHKRACCPSAIPLSKCTGRGKAGLTIPPSTSTSECGVNSGDRITYSDPAPVQSRVACACSSGSCVLQYKPITCVRRQYYPPHIRRSRTWVSPLISMDLQITRFPYWILAVLLLCQVSPIHGVYTRRPSDTKIVLGQNVTLPCAWSNNAVLILWQKGATILFSGKDRQAGIDSRYTLVNGSDLKITATTLLDSGTYTCTASGFPAVNGTLTVLVAPGQPIITPDISTRLLTEGNELELTCSSRGGNPHPQMKWKRGGTDVGSGVTNSATSVGETTTNELTLTLAWTDHGQTYTCLVWNEVNLDNPVEAAVTLSVRYAPRISFTPSFNPYTVVAGQDVVVTCEVDAYPNTVSYQWKKDGNDMLERANSVRFPSIGKDQGGVLTCLASNNVGERKNKSLSLMVQYEPEIVGLRDRFVVNESASFTLTCNADAQPTIRSVQWSTTGGDSRYVAAWVFDPILRSNADNYTCTVSNMLSPSGTTSVRRSTERTVQVVVQYAPGQARIESPQDSQIGDTVMLNCVLAEPGFPAGSYQWRKDDLPTSQTGQQYTIQGAQLSDSGLYKCRGTNELGIGPWGSVMKYINEPARLISSLPPSQNASKSQQNFELECEARGRPQPVIKWEKNGVAIDQQDNGSYQITESPVKTVDVYSFQVTSKLQFKGSMRSNNEMMTTDSGNYSCSTGTSPSQTVTIFVQYKPVVKVTPHKTVKNETISFHCIALANPEPRFAWYFKDAELNSADRYRIQSGALDAQNWQFQSRLTISSVVDTDLGQYTCNATNQLGSSTSAGHIVTKSVPDPCINLKVMDVTWASIFLQWEPGFDGGEPQTFIVSYTTGNDQQTVDVKTASVNLTGLAPSVAYELRVAGINSLGTGEASDLITETTKSYEIEPPKGVTFDSATNIVKFEEPNGTYFAKISVLVAGSSEWQVAEERVSGSVSVRLRQENIEKVQVVFCAKDQPNVCSAPAEAHVQPKTEESKDLPTEGVIAIACLCALIIIILFVVLFCVIRRRKREKTARDYELETQANRRSQPITTTVGRVPPPKHGYDNPDYVNARNNQPSRPNHVNSGQVMKMNGYQDSPDMNKSFDSSDPRLYGDDISKESEMYRGSSQSYHQSSDSKDPSINGMESGYSTPEPTKPKKLPKFLQRKRGLVYYGDRSCFSHDPPGHTCGLPCCQEGNDVPIVLGSSTGQCVGLQNSCHSSNFFMAKGSPPLFRRQQILKNGNFSLKPSENKDKIATDGPNSNSNLDSEKTLQGGKDGFSGAADTQIPSTNLSDFTIGESAEDFTESENFLPYYTSLPYKGGSEVRWNTKPDQTPTTKENTDSSNESDSIFHLYATLPVAEAGNENYKSLDLFQEKITKRPVTPMKSNKKRWMTKAFAALDLNSLSDSNLITDDSDFRYAQLLVTSEHDFDVDGSLTSTGSDVMDKQVDCPITLIL